MRVVVTGASGLVGSHLVRALQDRGHQAMPLGRPDFQLGREVRSQLLRGADALVHCAYDFAAIGEQEVRAANTLGTVRLLQAATEAGVSRVVFVSTIASFEGCRSIYGRCKLEAERAAREAGAVVVRPGLIFGDEQQRGLLGALTRVSRLPALPMIGTGGYLFYMVHVADLAAVLADLVSEHEKWRGRTVVAANPQPWSLADLVRALARQQGRGRPLMIPVPAGLALLGLRALERIGLRPRFRSDSLVSMIHYDRNPPFDRNLDAGARFRPFGGPPAG